MVHFKIEKNTKKALKFEEEKLKLKRFEQSEKKEKLVLISGGFII